MGTFRNDLLSSSLPRLPPRASTATMTTRATAVSDGSVIGPPVSAWGSPSVAADRRGEIDSRVESPTTRDGGGASTSAPIQMPTESSISVGIMRIADTLSRNVLPWQAVLCPKAVETLYDLRAVTTNAKHVTFITSMKEKLSDKVSSFMKKKEEEVEVWIEVERKAWATFMKNDETDLSDFIKRDLDRISSRAIAQDNAYRVRELEMATGIDDHERDGTRQQLINFRRIVQANNSGADNANKMFQSSEIDPLVTPGAGEKNVAVEVRVLQDAIAKAQSVTQKKMTKAQRDVIR
jgi:hypothetical protein